MKFPTLYPIQGYLRSKLLLIHVYGGTIITGYCCKFGSLPHYFVEYNGVPVNNPAIGRGHAISWTEVSQEAYTALNHSGN